MAVEVDELYLNLNKLLYDICKFLTDETNYEKLSPISRKQADELITRSKHQLQEISKIRVDDSDGAYVDMERKSVESNEDDQNNIYSAVDELALPTTPVVSPNPYANLPAKELSLDVKYGSLSWKCKIILKFEKMRRIYGGVHNNWLLIYSSEKDCKPLQTFNLKCHKAQNVQSKQGKNCPQDFELICTLGERKSYYFVALTPKDMLQWITHINRCYDFLNKSENPSISDEDIFETYDTISEGVPDKKEPEEDEVSYDDIDIYSSNKTPQVNKPPDLPIRRSAKPNTPLPPIPITENDEYSTDISLTYDPVKSTASLDSNPSFSSEDDEDNIYEPFVAKALEKNTLLSIAQNNHNSKDLPGQEHFSHKEKPKTPMKPYILRENPKHFTALKK